MFEITDFQKIGVGLAGFGVAFLFLGVLLFFDKGLLALGNILFLCGLAFVIGLERTFRFFFQRHKLRGTLAFFGGIFVVIFGFPLIGIIIETYGFVLLFRSLPTSMVHGSLGSQEFGRHDSSDTRIGSCLLLELLRPTVKIATFWFLPGSHQFPAEDTGPRIRAQPAVPWCVSRSPFG
ncbi:vesicle transport protein GOT1B isoform X1 [Ixodes scapularis]|uniref:vesicle transport protein GOT1B isoform X1 n=1 Tax=Ixodes scapularis TaxID=6945 RepID=UPI001C38ADAB|nr:vesicle transport protein GOT1B isoform X1 [Ixodes scapularis]